MLVFFNFAIFATVYVFCLSLNLTQRQYFIASLYLAFNAIHPPLYRRFQLPLTLGSPLADDQAFTCARWVEKDTYFAVLI